jgi:hypothetical protein
MDKKNVDKILPCEISFLVLGIIKNQSNERQTDQLVPRRHRMVGMVSNR